MAISTFYKALIIFFLAGMVLSCRKKFLDKKSDSSLLVPTTLEDFRALLDYDRVMGETPMLGELSSDNFYLPQNFWSGLNVKEKNAYVWAKEIYYGTIGIGDWDKPYQQVFYANIVFEGLEKIEKTAANEVTWNDIMGTALFLRSYAFYNILQIFSPVYSTSTLGDLGIPLRLKSDINQPSIRSTLKQSYDQVITDLKLSLNYLSEDTPTHFLNRPSKAAVHALLARVYLSMSDYGKALTYADTSLLLYSKILPYDSISNFSVNREVLYQSKMISTTVALRSAGAPCYIDSILFNSYDIKDKRRSLYFNLNGPIPTPRQSYSMSIYMFSGLATDEVYLIKAESLARTGNYAEGINTLNSLLAERFVDSDFVPVTASSQQEALDKILLERRKELVFRGLRWTDLKRLNKDGANIILRRKLGSQDYLLPPNHPNYILPLPPDVSQAPNSREEL